MKKTSLEISLVKADFTGIPEKRLLKMRNLVQIDLIWPRSGIAKKSAAREVVFRKGKIDFSDEPWAKRVLFREDIEDHCGVAVAITEPVSVQKIKRWLRLSAKYALKMGADYMAKALVGYADIATSPVDALAQMLGEKDSPKVTAQGIVDFTKIPGEGETIELEIPLVRPLTKVSVGSFTLRVSA